MSENSIKKHDALKKTVKSKKALGDERELELLTDEKLEELKYYTSIGLSNKALVRVLGISTTMLYKMRNKYKEFEDAYNAGIGELAKLSRKTLIELLQSNSTQAAVKLNICMYLDSKVDSLIDHHEYSDTKVTINVIPKLADQMLTQNNISIKTNTSNEICQEDV